MIAINLINISIISLRALEDTAKANQQPIEQMERMQRALEDWQAQVRTRINWFDKKKCLILI